MNRTVLYINDTYIQDLEQIKEILSNPILIREDSIRCEILSSYRDGVLGKWFSERGEILNVVSSSNRDDDVFISLYKAIVGAYECPNFNSDFSKLGELVRCEVGSNSYPINNSKEIIIDTRNKELKIRFVFKSYKVDNNIRSFSIKADNDIIESDIKYDWNDKTKGKEHYFERSLVTSQLVGKHLSLIEGTDNILCNYFCKGPDHNNIELLKHPVTAFYVGADWLVLFKNKESFETIESIIQELSDYKLRLLSHSEVDNLKKHSQIWNKVKNEDFWVNNGLYYDPHKKIIMHDEWEKKNYNKRCLLIVGNPSLLPELQENSR